MKSKFSVFGIITLVLIVGLVSFGCGGGAGSSNPPPREPIISPNVGKLVPIPAGTFTMGQSDIAIATPHSVTLSAFYMSEYELTQAQYKAVMDGANPSHFKEDNLPVETVTWYDAIEFCNMLSEAESLTPAYHIGGNTNPDTWTSAVKCNWSANGYRLPTEAEWEYACRAGTPTAYSTGNTITTSQANFNSSTTTVVGTYPANAYGLYDMPGNVWEWCWDWYDNYESGAQTDPTGASSGAGRVIRGGSWFFNSVEGLRSAARSYYNPSSGSDYIGFRLVHP
jgi:formylglycine-generating enzyme required for sulfatase activity